eukprot:PhM_4_TR17026/c0_g2_i1/m.38943/K10420/DYNLT; dynein light chain Tctex-type 1
MSDDLTVGEEVGSIVKDVVDRVMMASSSTTTYNHTTAASIMSSITETCMARITQHVNMPRKYVVHCMVVQRNGSGLAMSTSCLWDRSLDGTFTYQHDTPIMSSITTVFGVSL